MPDFLDDFAPQNGDLLYGLSPARHTYKSRFYDDRVAKLKVAAAGSAAEGLIMEEVGALGWHTIDTYNDHFGSSGPGLSGPTTILDRFREQVKTVPTGSAERGKAYMHNLVDSRFSPALVRGADPAKIQEEGHRPQNYADSRGFVQRLLDKGIDERNAKALSQNLNYLAIRRACKFGIGLVAEDATFRQAGAMIRFALDGLDMSEVIEKRTRPSGSGVDLGTKQAVSITVSELRYVYRNWGKLNATVRFYINLDRVQAPWVANFGPVAPCPPLTGSMTNDKDDWDQYHQARLAKYNGNIPAKSLYGPM